MFDIGYIIGGDFNGGNVSKTTDKKNIKINPKLSGLTDKEKRASQFTLDKTSVLNYQLVSQSPNGNWSKYTYSINYVLSSTSYKSLIEFNEALHKTFLASQF